MHRFIAALTLAGALTACGGSDSNPPATVPLAATWTSIHANVIAPKCAGCHSGTGFGNVTGGLDMSTKAAAYANLRDVASTFPSRPKRIDPTSTDPSQSLLYLKVTLTASDVTNGAPMPPPPAPGLSAAEQNAIRDWIVAGAPND